MNFLIVTGLSGAGKSMAVNALEDIGFFCIDNIPAGLLPRILDFAQQGENQLSRVAVVMDIRGLLRRIESFLEYALPLYVKEGKSQLMIAIGCTGGKHRSITFARKIGEYCTKLGYQPSVQHRDARRTA